MKHAGYLTLLQIKETEDNRRNGHTQEPNHEPAADQAPCFLIVPVEFGQPAAE